MNGKYKFAFNCNCGRSPIEVGFLPEHFIKSTSVYLDLLPDLWWTIDRNGKVSCDCDGHRWPEELSKRFFMQEARKYARKVLKGETSLYCDECGEDLVITKI